MSEIATSGPTDNALVYFEYGRDTNGDIISMRREDGQTSYYEYDDVRRLTKETIVNSAMAVMYGYEYDFDAAGNRTYLKVTAGSSAEIYYEYDAANAITRRHTLTSAAGRTAGWAYYEYNGNGSLTSYKNETGAETTYIWDDNQLCKAIVPPTGQPTYFYYDGRLTRYAMGKYGTAGTTYFAWDGINILQTETLHNERTHRVSLTHGATPIAGIGSVVEQKRTGFQPATRYLHNDHRGTTYKITDDAGNEVWSGLTDAYGVELGETGTPDQSIYWYQGQAWYRHEIGFDVVYVSPTRIYVPEDGRFIQRDLIPRVGGLSYRMKGNPRVVDPSGAVMKAIKNPGNNGYYDIYDKDGKFRGNFFPGNPAKFIQKKKLASGKIVNVKHGEYTGHEAICRWFLAQDKNGIEGLPGYEFCGLGSFESPDHVENLLIETVFDPIQSGLLSIYEGSAEVGGGVSRLSNAAGTGNTDEIVAANLDIATGTTRIVKGLFLDIAEPFQFYAGASTMLVAGARNSITYHLSTSVDDVGRAAAAGNVSDAARSAIDDAAQRIRPGARVCPETAPSATGSVGWYNWGEDTIHVAQQAADDAAVIIAHEGVERSIGQSAMTGTTPWWSVWGHFHSNSVPAAVETGGRHAIGWFTRSMAGREAIIDVAAGLTYAPGLGAAGFLRSLGQSSSRVGYWPAAFTGGDR